MGNSDLEAVIAGGDRSVALSGVEELSAELSTDPDGDSLTFEWTCMHLDGSLDCSDLADSTSAVLLVDRDLLGFRSFQFTVIVTNEASSATASVVLTHIVDPPSVLIEGPSSRIAVANERLVLKGRVESELEATATWDIGDFAENARTDLSASGTAIELDLVLPKFILSEGTYVFRLEAVADGDVGFAEISVIVPSPPSGGDLQVTPRNGTALVTEFSFAANHWSGDGPLLYRFELRGGQVLRTSSRSPSISASLPVGTSEAFVIVTDASTGATANASTTVNVTALNDLSVDMARTFLSRAANASSYEDVCNVAIAVASADASTDIVALLMDAVAESRRRVLIDSDAEIVALFAACLRDVLVAPTDLTRDTAALALTEVTDVISAADSFNFDDDATSNALGVLSQLLESSLFSSDDRRRLEETVTVNFTTAVDALTNRIAEPLETNEFAALVETQNVRIAARRSSGLAVQLPDADVPVLQEAYLATSSRFLVNTHRLEAPRDLTSLDGEAFVRFGLDVNATATLYVPFGEVPEVDRLNVTLECPWNFKGEVTAECLNETITKQCTGEKATFVEGCGDTSRNACVRWDPLALEWDETCVVNSQASTTETTACDCAVKETRDYSTRSVLETYRFVFASELTRGSVNAQRARIMIGVLCGFVALVASLMFLGHRKDQQQSGGAPPQAEGALRTMSDLIIRRRRSIELDDKRRSWVSQFRRALYFQHPFSSIWTVFRPREPRALRIGVLAIEIILYAGMLAFEQSLEYPDPRCSKRRSERTCLRRKSFGGRRTCKWSENDGVCSHNQPPSVEHIASLDHFMTVFIVTVLLIPIAILFEKSVGVLLGYLAPPQKPAKINTDDLEEDDDDVEMVGLQDDVVLKKNEGAPPSSEDGGVIVEDPFLATAMTPATPATPANAKATKLHGQYVVYGLPSERRANLSHRLRHRLHFHTKSEILTEARARAPGMAEAVRNRHAEIRQDIKKEAKRCRQSVVAARKVKILTNIERHFVTKYGYVEDATLLEQNVLNVVYRDLKLAKRWQARLEEVSPEKQMELFHDLVKASQLTQLELEVYERTFEDDDDDDDPPEYSLVVTALAALCVAFCALAPGAYLIFYASDVGRKETVNFIHELVWVLFLLYVLVQPMQVFINYVAMPALIHDKVNANRKVNTARYPFKTPLPEDAIDYLLELRPDLEVPAPTDAFVVALQTVPKSILHAFISDSLCRAFSKL